MFQELCLGQAPAVTHTLHAQLSTPGSSDALTDEERRSRSAILGDGGNSSMADLCGHPSTAVAVLPPYAHIAVSGGNVATIATLLPILQSRTRIPLSRTPSVLTASVRGTQKLWCIPTLATTTEPNSLIPLCQSLSRGN